MAFFCVVMLDISLELAQHDPVYEDMASKFFEHFVLIVDAMNKIGACEGQGLWDEEDGFYYDCLRWVEHTVTPAGVSSPLPVGWMGRVFQ